MKTSFLGKLLAGLCLCLGMAGGLLAQPTINVTITGTLGPYISGSGWITNGGIYQSGVVATGTKSTQYCVITYTGGNGGATARIYLGSNFGTNQPVNGPQTIGQGSALLTFGSGYSYPPPTTATVSDGPGTTCTGTAVVSGVKIDDSLSLIGTAFTANATLAAEGVTYSPTSETYLNVPLSLTDVGLTFMCTTSATVSTAGPNDTLTSGCEFKAGGGTLFSANGAFPLGSIPAPIPLPFEASILTNGSMGSYTPEGTQTFAGDVTTLGVMPGATVTAVCSGCPVASLSPTGPLMFTAAVGGSAPAAQSVTVNNSPVENEAYAVTTSASWITVNNGSTTGGSTGGSFNVGVNPTGLAAGNYTGAVNVYTAASNVTATTPLTITVNLTVAALPPTITTTSLSNGEAGLAYSAQLAATGGTPPYITWAVSSGSLPAGLSLNSSTGAITGTPTTAGSSPFSVTVKDSGGNTSAAQPLTITVIAGVTVLTSSLPNGVTGVGYSQTLSATGGVPPYSNWTLTTGSMPAGLTLKSSTGVISGPPTTAGASSFSVTVRDNAGDISPAAPLSITIVAPLAITTTSLVNGTVGLTYSQTLGATGGVPPYSNWTIATGSLPAGLTLNSSTGVIGGSPTIAGSASFSVFVKDSAGNTAPSVGLSITINPPLTVFTTSLPNAEVNALYSATLTATGGTPPYSNWTVTVGSLPAGLTLNSSTGLIGGTPTAAGLAPFTVTVKDSANTTSPAQSLSISVISGLTITTTSLPNGTVGTAYSQTLAAAGGTPPYSNWTVTVGSLPAGLSLNAATGTISGMPTTAGAPTFSVTVKDSTNTTSPAQPLSITIVNAVSIVTTTLPNGAVGTSYNQTLAATGGTPPYSNWTVSSGTLPAGLSLSSASGVISGTPTTVGAFPFSVTVKDSAGNPSPAQALSITIVAGVTITTTSLPNGTVGVAYSQMLAATGGTPPYSNWTLSSGLLPAGLTLNAATGAIGGTPTTAGASSFSVKVKDNAGNTSSAQALSITIVAPLAITTASLPNATVGAAYSQALAATGGAPPYSNWTVTSGSLPTGLTLSAATGVISGTPTTATGSPFSFSVTVSDSASSTSPAKALSITIGTATLKIGVPSNYLFVLANTAAPAAGELTIVASDGSALPFTVTATPTGFNWLTFAPPSGVTPATITLTANPAGLVPGVYPIPLIVKSGSLSLTVQAQLTITGSNLAVSPSVLTFAYQPGLPLPAPQTLSLTTISGASVALASVTSNAPWLIVSSASSAPATLHVSVNPVLLAAGTYYGYVLVKGVGSPDTSLQVPVSITVGATPQLTVNPNSLTFNYQTGGALPVAQSFAVAGNSPVNFTVASPGSWLQLSPLSGTTPASVMVTANPAGLAPGTYGGTINVTASGSITPVPVAVTLTITAPPQLTIAPAQLTFAVPVNGAAPAPQTLTVTSNNGPLAFTAAAGSIWLSVTPTNGNTPATLAVSVNPTGLATGVYNGTINITQAGAVIPQMILVTLQVGNVTPTIAGVINAASGVVGTVAPGMAISIFGAVLGPQTGVGFAAPPEGGTVATMLAGTQVLFDGAAVPLLFTLSGQVNALAPFELSGKASTVLQVVYNGVTSAGMTLPVVPSEPGLFTASATGKGEGAILNQDGSINSASNPAAAGSTIQLFGTGGGVTIPPSTEGALNPLTSTGALALGTTATVGGQTAFVYYAGPAPNLVSGIIQINVTLPSGTPSGSVPVVVTVGCPTAPLAVPAACAGYPSGYTASSQTTVTVAVQ